MRTTDLDDDTLSKIDVDTMEVVGRYRTSHGLGGAYAVSIGLNGDIVATSLAVDLDRPGGPFMMKIHADEADCLDINGEPGIQTSMGSAPLEWGEDECVAWVSTLEGSGSAAHWAAGVWDPPTCRFVDQRIWTVTNTVDGLLVRLVDSVDGSVVDSVVGSLPGDGFIDGRDMTVDLDNNPPSSESTRTTS